MLSVALKKLPENATFRAPWDLNLNQPDPKICEALLPFFLDGDHGMALKLGNDDHLAMIHGAYAWKKKHSWLQRYDMSATKNVKVQATVCQGHQVPFTRY